MNKHLILTSVFAVAASAALQAQNNIEPLKASIPFDFVAGQTTMSAGEYVVNDVSHPGFVILKGVGGAANAIVLVNPLRSLNVQTGGKLTFHRYGDVYFLSEVWRADTSSGSQVRPTRRERELSAAPGVQRSAAIVAVR